MSKKYFRENLKDVALTFVNKRYRTWDEKNSENKWTE